VLSYNQKIGQAGLTSRKKAFTIRHAACPVKVPSANPSLYMQKVTVAEFALKPETTPVIERVGISADGHGNLNLE